MRQCVWFSGSRRDLAAVHGYAAAPSSCCPAPMRTVRPRPGAGTDRPWFRRTPCRIETSTACHSPGGVDYHPGRQHRALRAGADSSNVKQASRPRSNDQASDFRAADGGAAGRRNGSIANQQALAGSSGCGAAGDAHGGAGCPVHGCAAGPAGRNRTARASRTVWRREGQVRQPTGCGPSTHRGCVGRSRRKPEPGHLRLSSCRSTGSRR